METSYKEKYEQALAKAKEQYNYPCMRSCMGILEEIFPELAESEDEKVRKALIDFFGKGAKYGGQTNGVYDKDILAWLEKQGEKHPDPYNGISFEYNGHIWGMCARDNGVDISCDKHLIKHLEKQGEQKPADNVSPKFHEGEWIACEELNTAKIVNINGDRYEVEFIDGNKGFPHIDYIDRLFHLWTIQDTKDGDVLKEDSCIFILEKMKSQDTAITHCCLFDDGDFNLSSKICFDVDSTYPATKEQRYTLLKAMADAGYTFDFEKKELKEIEEEVNGEDYGIDGLWHAQRILEKTLGKVDGYQTDDGILSHKCAITAVKKLYEQKPVEENKGNIGGNSSNWSEVDEEYVKDTLALIGFGLSTHSIGQVQEWLQSLQDRVQPQPKQEWSEEDKYMYDILCGTIENTDINENTKYKLISWLKSLRPQNRWKPSEGDIIILEKLIKGELEPKVFQATLQGILEQLKKLRDE